jgi:hypothetical protein
VRGTEPGRRSAGCTERKSSEAVPKIGESKWLVGKSREFEADRAEGTNVSGLDGKTACISADLLAMRDKVRERRRASFALAPERRWTAQREAVNGMHAPIGW